MNLKPFHALLATVSAFLIVKARVLLEYGFRFTGSDDTIFWQVANDYANFDFHEPFLYGQDYIYAIESLVSVPFLWLGVSPQYALPLGTLVVCLFPILYITAVLFRAKHHIASLVFLAIFIAMPVQYDLMTGITRGFVCGLFFCAFLIHPLLNPEKTSNFIVLGGVSALAYVSNPNSIIFSFPVCLFLLSLNYKKRSFYVYTFFSALVPLCIQFLSKSFYRINPDHLVHFMWDMDFSLSRLLSSFGKLDTIFRYLTPLFWPGHWLILVFILITGIFIYWKRSKKQGLIYLASLIFVLLTLGINKIHDHYDTIFFSSSRMFLALPFILGLGGIWAFKQDFSKRLIIPFICSILLLTIVKIQTIPKVVQKSTENWMHEIITIKSIEVLQEDCNLLAQITKEHDVELVVFSLGRELRIPDLECYNYACHFLTDSFPSSVLGLYERRSWVFAKHKTNTPSTILFLNVPEKRFCEVDDYEVLEEMNGGLILVKNNEKSILQLATEIGFSYKKNLYSEQEVYSLEDEDELAK